MKKFNFIQDDVKKVFAFQMDTLDLKSLKVHSEETRIELRLNSYHFYIGQCAISATFVI